MNPSNSEISFPHRPVELKVKRPRPSHQPDPAAAAEVPAGTVTPWNQSAGDLEALRVCEENLRAYEQRLREWQAELEQAQSEIEPRRAVQPGVNRSVATATLPARTDAWEKIVRARELLEVEQKHLRDDRITLQGYEQQLKEREARLAEREARVVAREQMLAQAQVAAAAPTATPRKPASPLDTLTRAPFSIAKSVFGAKA